jgi:hypothetical protein
VVIEDMMRTLLRHIISPLLSSSSSDDCQTGRSRKLNRSDADTPGRSVH